MDQLDSRYKDLREQLYTLGFHQQLPIGSLGIVSALLEDLIKVTDSYKKSKQTVKELQEEKEAWGLGVEPYKCDNSRLLSENNALHLEAIRVRDHHNKKLIELNHTIRNLELDKSYLEDHCFELVSKIREMDKTGGRVASKYRENGQVILHKKAFVSTVRSGNIVPHPNVVPPNHCHTRRSDGKCSDGSQVEVVKLQNDIHALKDETDMLKKQLYARDREIDRLHNEMSGGRPVAALGRDCCYRGIDTLAEDMKLLQKQLIATKNELKDSLEQQHEAKLRAIKLDEQNTNLARELREMEEVALKVQEGANAKLMSKEKHLSDIECKWNEALRRIAFLEADGCKPGSSTLQQTKDIKNMKSALKKVNEENDNLLEKIKDLMDKEVKCDEKIKELTRKNEKLEAKLKADLNRPERCQELKSQATLTDPECKATFSKEKLIYQTEYLRRLNQPAYERELEHVQSQLAEREMEIHDLRERLAAAPPPVTKRSQSHTSISVQSAMNRLEREAHLSKLDIERLKAEKDDFQQKYKMISGAYQSDQQEHTRRCVELSSAIEELENENLNLRGMLEAQVPNQTKMLNLTDEIAKLRETIEDQNTQLCLITTSYNQIKLLQGQTEKSLLDHQHRLYQTDQKLDQAQSELSAKDSKHEFTNRTIGNLKAEIAKLTKIVEMTERDKNELVMQLDNKTEKMFQMEIDIKKLRLDNDELNLKIQELRRGMSNKSHESLSKSNTIERSSKEMESLKKQKEHLQALNENLSTDNNRLNNEIIELTCACNDMKKRLGTSEQESRQQMKRLQEYIQKVENAEELLMRKDEQRDAILDQYTTVSKEILELEGTNHSLELEIVDAKRCLAESDEKLYRMQEILEARDGQITAMDCHITEMSKQLTAVECELKTSHMRCDALQVDNNATKDLCDKLDIEKDKLKEELNECLDIRRKLEQENEKLNKDLKKTLSEGVDNGVIDGLRELLSATRKELEQERDKIGEREVEIKKMRVKINEIEKKIEEEKAISTCCKASAEEYCVQVNELREQLTKVRFEAAVAKEKTDDYDRNMISNERFLNDNRIEVSNTEALNSRQSIHLKNSIPKARHSMKNEIRRLFPGSDSPNSEIKTHWPKKSKDTTFKDTSDDSRHRTRDRFSEANSGENKRSFQSVTNYKTFDNSVVVHTSPIQNDKMGHNESDSSLSCHSDSFANLNDRMNANQNLEQNCIVLHKTTQQKKDPEEFQTSINDRIDVDDDKFLISQHHIPSILSPELLESSKQYIQNVRQNENPSQFERKSVFINHSISYESTEEYLTCSSSSSVPQNISKNKKTIFDISNCSPPPQCPRVIRGTRRISQRRQYSIEVAFHQQV